MSKPKSAIPRSANGVSYHGILKFPDGEFMFHGLDENLNRIGMFAILEDMVAEHWKTYSVFKYSAFNGSEVQMAANAQSEMMRMIEAAANPSTIEESPFARLYRIDPDFALNLLTQLREAQKKELDEDEKAFVAMRFADKIPVDAHGHTDHWSKCKNELLASVWGVSVAAIKRASKKHARGLKKPTQTIVVASHRNKAQKSSAK